MEGWMQEWMQGWVMAPSMSRERPGFDPAAIPSDSAVIVTDSDEDVELIHSAPPASVLSRPLKPAPARDVVALPPSRPLRRGARADFSRATSAEDGGALAGLLSSPSPSPSPAPAETLPHVPDAGSSGTHRHFDVDLEDRRSSDETVSVRSWQFPSPDASDHSFDVQSEAAVAPPPQQTSPVNVPARGSSRLSGSGTPVAARDHHMARPTAKRPALDPPLSDHVVHSSLASVITLNAAPRPRKRLARSTAAGRADERISARPRPVPPPFYVSAVDFRPYDRAPDDDEDESDVASLDVIAHELRNTMQRVDLSRDQRRLFALWNLHIGNRLLPGRAMLCRALRSFLEQRLPLLRAWNLRAECMLMIAHLRDTRQLTRDEAANFVVHLAQLWDGETTPGGDPVLGPVWYRARSVGQPRTSDSEDDTDTDTEYTE